MPEGSLPDLSRAQLFEGAELLKIMTPYENAKSYGFKGMYEGTAQLERWVRPDGSEFTWVSELLGLHHRAEVMLYQDGVAKYRMYTFADADGWHDGPWQEVPEGGDMAANIAPYLESEQPQESAGEEMESMLFHSIMNLPKPDTRPIEEIRGDAADGQA